MLSEQSSCTGSLASLHYQLQELNITGGCNEQLLIFLTDPVSSLSLSLALTEDQLRWSLATAAVCPVIYHQQQVILISTNSLSCLVSSLRARNP